MNFREISDTNVANTVIFADQVLRNVFTRTRILAEKEFTRFFSMIDISSEKLPSGICSPTHQKTCLHDPFKRIGREKESLSVSTDVADVHNDYWRHSSIFCSSLPAGDAVSDNCVFSEGYALDIGDQLADISDLLSSTDDDLDSNRHPTHITKTVYPTMTDRQKMKISTMYKKIK